MKKFSVKDGHFWLDDKQILIQAGEFHYYRTPVAEWAHRLNLLKEAGFNAVASYMPWIWHQVEEDQFDFDGHSHPMRDLAGYLDLAAEMGLLIIARPGPYIMAETINEGVPPWVFENYPQSAFVSQHGKVQNVASYLHPDFLNCCRKWYQGIFQILTPRQITRGGNIIMSQLDNEMGMIAWVRNIIDTNPHTMQQFAEFIRNAPDGSLSGTYPAGNLAEYLREGIMRPDFESSPHIVVDYRRFYRQYLREYAAFLWSEALTNGMEVPPIVNIHGFANGGKTFPIGISQLIEVMRMPGMISATDVYPGIIGEGNIHHLYLVNEMTKALQNPDQPLFSVEFQCGGNLDFSNTQASLYDLHTRLCLSSGMRAINHYLFFAGENDPILSHTKRHDWGPPVRKDGSLRRHYHRYPELSAVLNTYGDAFTTAMPKAVTTLGFQLDYFMTEVDLDITKPSSKAITHQTDAILFDMLARGLTLSHRPYNALDLDTQILDPEQTPVIWTLMEKQCHPATQQKLVDYVETGGSLVLAGRMCVEDFNHKECTTLKDALGITCLSDDLLYKERLITVFNQPDIPVSFLETYQGSFDEVIATDEHGSIVGFIKTVGKGKAIMLSAAMPVTTLEELDIINQLAQRVSCPALFTLTEWADVQLSEGEKGNFLFINNYQDDPISTVISLYNSELFAGHPISVPARRGLILPLDWRLNDEILIHYATTEIRHVELLGDALILTGAQDAFTIEMTVSAYAADGVNILEENANQKRIRVTSQNGKVILRKEK